MSISDKVGVIVVGVGLLALGLNSGCRATAENPVYNEAVRRVEATATAKAREESVSGGKTFKVVTPKPLTREEEYKEILSEWGIDPDKTKIYSVKVLRGDTESGYLEVEGYTPAGHYQMNFNDYSALLELLNPCSNGLVNGVLQESHILFISGGQVQGIVEKWVNVPDLNGDGRFVGFSPKTGSQRDARLISLEEALACD